MSVRATWLTLTWWCATLPCPLLMAQTSSNRVDQPQTADPALVDLEPFVPATPRSEADEDRAMASALFAQGRLLLQRERFSDAIAKYQRAFLFGNGAGAIAGEIIPICYHQQRVDEAIRYGLKLPAEGEVNPLILRQLAIDLAGRGQFDEAIEFQQRVLQSLQAPDDDAVILVTQFEIGRLCYLQERYEEAAHAFQHVRERINQVTGDPVEDATLQPLLRDAAVTYTVMAESFLEAGAVEAATEYYRKANFENPNEALLAFHLARVAHQQGDDEAALSGLQKYFSSKLTDGGTEPYEVLGKVLEARGKRGEFLPQLLRLQQQTPDNVYLGYTIANELLAEGRTDEARKQLQQLVRQAPTLEGFRSLLATLLNPDDVEELSLSLSRVTELMGTLEPVEESARKILDDTKLWQRLQEYTREQNAVDQPPERIARRSLPVALLAVMGDENEVANEFYRQAVEHAADDKQRILFSWALDLLVSDQVEQSIEKFEELRTMDLSPDLEAEIQFYLAGALAIQERYDDSLQAAKRAAELAPELPVIQVRPAWVRYLSGDYEAARTAYEEFLATFGSNYELSAVRDAVREAKVTLGALCVLLNDHEAAEEWLLQVLDEFPDDVGASNDLGYLWADRNVHLQRSLAMIQHAVEAEPDNVAYRDSLGWVLFRLGRLDEALVELQKASAVEEPDGVILDHLADVLLAKGDTDAAVEAWKRAIAHLDADETERRQEIQTKIEKFTQE